MANHAARHRHKGITILATSLTLALALTLTDAQVQGQSIFQGTQTFQPQGPRNPQGRPLWTGGDENFRFPSETVGPTRSPFPPGSRFPSQSFLNSQSQRLSGMQGSMSGVRPGAPSFVDRDAMLQRQQQLPQRRPLSQFGGQSSSQFGGQSSSQFGGQSPSQFGGQPPQRPQDDPSMSIRSSMGPGMLRTRNSLTREPQFRPAGPAFPSTRSGFGSLGNTADMSNQLTRNPFSPQSRLVRPPSNFPRTGQTTGQVGQDPRTAANTRTLSSQTLGDLQGPPTVPGLQGSPAFRGQPMSSGSQQSPGRVRFVSQAEYQEILRRQRIQQLQQQQEEEQQQRFQQQEERPQRFQQMQQQTQQQRLQQQQQQQRFAQGVPQGSPRRVLGTNIPNFPTVPGVPGSVRSLPMSQSGRLLQQQQDQLLRRRQELEDMRQRLALQRRMQQQQQQQQDLTGAQEGPFDPNPTVTSGGVMSGGLTGNSQVRPGGTMSVRGMSSTGIPQISTRGMSSTGIPQMSTRGTMSSSSQIPPGRVGLPSGASAIANTAQGSSFTTSSRDGQTAVGSDLRVDGATPTGQISQGAAQTGVVSPAGGVMPGMTSMGTQMSASDFTSTVQPPMLTDYIRSTEPPQMSVGDMSNAGTQMSGMMSAGGMLPNAGNQMSGIVSAGGNQMSAGGLKPSAGNQMSGMLSTGGNQMSSGGVMPSAGNQMSGGMSTGGMLPTGENQMSSQQVSDPTLEPSLSNNTLPFDTNTMPVHPASSGVSMQGPGAGVANNVVGREMQQGVVDPSAGLNQNNNFVRGGGQNVDPNLSGLIDPSLSVMDRAASVKLTGQPQVDPNTPVQNQWDQKLPGQTQGSNNFPGQPQVDPNTQGQTQVDPNMPVQNQWDSNLPLQNQGGSNLPGQTQSDPNMPVQIQSSSILPGQTQAGTNLPVQTQTNVPAQQGVHSIGPGPNSMVPQMGGAQGGVGVMTGGSGSTLGTTSMMPERTFVSETNTPTPVQTAYTTTMPEPITIQTTTPTKAALVTSPILVSATTGKTEPVAMATQASIASTAAPTAAVQPPGTNSFQDNPSIPMHNTSSAVAAAMIPASDPYSARDLELLKMIERLNKQLDELLVAQNSAPKSPKAADPLMSVDPSLVDVAGTMLGFGTTTEIPRTVTKGSHPLLGPHASGGATAIPFEVQALPPKDSMERQMMESAFRMLWSDMNGVPFSQANLVSFSNSVSPSMEFHNFARKQFTTDPLAGKSATEGFSTTQTDTPVAPWPTQPASGSGQTASNPAAVYPSLMPTGIPASVSVNPPPKTATQITTSPFIFTTPQYVQPASTPGPSGQPSFGVSQDYNGPASSATSASNGPFSPTIPASNGPFSPTIPASNGPLSPTISASNGPLSPTIPASNGPLSSISPISNDPVSPAGQAFSNDLLNSSGAASNGPVSPTVLIPPTEFDLKQAVQDPVFFNLLEAHLHQLMANGGSLAPQGPASVLSQPSPPQPHLPIKTTTVSPVPITQAATTQAKMPDNTHPPPNLPMETTTVSRVPITQAATRQANIPDNTHPAQPDPNTVINNPFAVTHAPQAPVQSQPSTEALPNTVPAASVDLVLVRTTASPTTPSPTGGTGQNALGSADSGFDLRQAVNDPVFINMLEAHIKQLMSKGGSPKPGASPPRSSAGEGVVSSTVPPPPVALTTAFPVVPNAGVSVQGVVQPTGVNIQNAVQTFGLNSNLNVDASIGASLPASQPAPSLPASQPAPSLPASQPAPTVPVITQADAMRAFLLANTATTPPSVVVNFNPWEPSSQPSASSAAATSRPVAFSPNVSSMVPPPSIPQLPVVSKSTFQSLQTVYGAIQHLKSTSSPTVMLQIKHLLQMFPPQQAIDISKFQQVTLEQLAALGIPVSTAHETNAVGASMNALSQVYSISLDQLMQLFSGKTPSQIAVVGQATQTTVVPPAGALPTTVVATTTMAATTTPPTTVMTTTAFTGEIPEPGDPGFIEYYFRVGKQLTAEDLAMLKQQMAELSGV